MTKPGSKRMYIIDFHGTELRFNRNPKPLPTVKMLDAVLAMYRDGAPVKDIYAKTGLGTYRLPHFLRRINEPARARRGLKKPPEHYAIRCFQINGKKCVEFNRYVAIEGRWDRVRFFREEGEDAKALLEAVVRDYSDPTQKIRDIAKRMRRSEHWVWYTALALGATPRVHGGYKPTHRLNSMTDRRRVWTGEN